MSSKRIPRPILVLAALGGLALLGLIGLLVWLLPGGDFGRAFKKSFVWAYSPERLALRGAGCINPIVTPRPSVESFRRHGTSEKQIARMCGDDGFCSTELVQCGVVPQNDVPCAIVASIHHKHAKPTLPYRVMALNLTTFQASCHELYGEDGKLALDLKPQTKPSKPETK